VLPGTPPEQVPAMHALLLVGTLPSSATFMVPPLPLQTTVWQDPGTWPPGLPCPLGT
jgi:hypothetical protein